MFRIDIKQKFLSVRSAFVRLFRFFGFVRMPDRKSPLFRSEREFYAAGVIGPEGLTIPYSKPDGRQK